MTSNTSSPTSATTALPLSAPLPLPPELTHNSKFGVAFPDAPGTSIPLIPPPEEPEPEPSKPEPESEPPTPGDLGTTPLPRMARSFSTPVQRGHLKHPSRPPGFGSPASSYSSQPYTPGLSTIYQPGDYVAEKQPPFSGLSLELADTAQLVIQTLLQLSPPHLLDPAHEQFSGCTLQLPTTSIGGMLTAMKSLNWMSVRLAGFVEDNSTLESIVEEHPNDIFDVGEMLQSVGDVLSGIAAQAGIDIVIYHADVGLKHVGVQGDEGAASYALSHIVRQVLAIAEPGETVELGLYIDTKPEGVVCSFEITHRMHSHLESRAPPQFDTTILRRLLTHIRATLQAKPPQVPSSPTLTAAPDAPPTASSTFQTYTLTIPFTSTSAPLPVPTLTPEQEEERQPFPTLRLASEPTLDELSKFAETQLRGKRATFYASPKSSFARHLTSYLTTWGVEVEHCGVGTEDLACVAEPDPAQSQPASSGPVSFIIIDDDVSVLRKRLSLVRAESTPPTTHSRKRPSLAANHRPRSSPHIRQLIGIPESPPNAGPVVVHFTSLANYKVVRDAVQSVLGIGPAPEVLVIPKPAGPRRFLTALHTAVTKPLVDPVFAPIATSPTSPTASTPSPPRTQRVWTPGSGTQRPSPLAIESSREYFSETAEMVLESAVSPNPSEVGVGAGAGVVLQDLQGKPAGILFQPKPRSSTGGAKGLEGETSPLSAVSAPGVGIGGIRKSAPTSPSTPAPAGSGSGRRATLDSARSPSGTAQPPFLRTKSGGKARSRENSGSKEEEKEPPVPSRKSSDRRRGSGTEIKSPGGIKAKGKKKDAGIVPPISVLIVEDNPINQTILSTFIKRKKIKCDVAQNGLQAVEKWKTGRFHLIFMDIQMPVMDGIEATREIRRLEKVQHGSVPTPPVESPGLSESKQLFTPSSDSKLFMSGPSSPFRSSVVIVALTASSLQSDRVAALAAGCNDFLTKPVALDWLDKKIIEWGSIKALQMWADPEMARSFQRGQEAKAKAVATQLRIERKRAEPSRPEPTRQPSTPIRQSSTPIRQPSTPTRPGPEIHVQAPTPPANERPGLARRVTKSPSPLSRSMVLPPPPPVPGLGREEVPLFVLDAPGDKGVADGVASGVDGVAGGSVDGVANKDGVADKGTDGVVDKGPDGNVDGGGPSSVVEPPSAPAESTVDALPPPASVVEPQVVIVPVAEPPPTAEPVAKPTPPPPQADSYFPPAPVDLTTPAPVPVDPTSPTPVPVGPTSPAPAPVDPTSPSTAYQSANSLPPSPS